MDQALEIERAGKVYKGFALREISFGLPKGYMMGLIGPNGAGKTTLIKMILNLVRRDEGSVRVFGLECRTHEKEIKARIGFVPDEPRYHDDVTLADIKAATAPFYPGWDEAGFEALAGRFGLPMRKKFKTLSHGTKTKFALALALSHGAELILLDEPTAGLDPVVRRDLLGLLAEILHGGGVSILFSSHITSDLEKMADFITFLREGRVVLSCPKDDLMETWAVVRGGREMLDADARSFFQGIRVRAHGFEALTSRREEARRRFGEKVVIDRASLDDIMFLMGSEERHAA
ncbi:MAG TPA: ABC transporter ATP-binding protein [Candidatus Saccharimonadales bacterium]|nr:ABC transporter ATP-binding protein [Candidatus Saccharimonadales bacterium]